MSVPTINISYCFAIFQIQSQEDVISVLTQQVTDLKMEKLTIETEFEQYRKHSQVFYN